MTTLNTTEDLLRAARVNQEFREAFRREILTEELLELPKRLADYAAVTDERLSRIEAIVAENSKSIAENSKSIAENSKSIAELTRSIAAMNRNLNEKIDEIRASHRAEHDALHRFRGNYAIETTRNSDGDIAELFAVARDVNRYRLRTLTREERDDLFDDNLDTIDSLDTEGNISKSFPAGDVIAEASYRRNREAIFYIAVEASYTVNADDVIRASDHAKILRKVTGREAFAVVSGVEVNTDIGDLYRQRIIEDINVYMESERDDVVFWFHLTDRSLEPPPPC